ncbi:MAG: ABC transporter substrate-binding protein [Mobilicoccus sp.]|nr:ABC transporter substrate-binding protein [Mobilicoccus sp.]
MSASPLRRFAALATLGVLLSACADAPQAGAPATTTPETDAFPVTISNCGVDVTLEQPPSAAVTLNQGATEVALALDLTPSLAGTAYLDDAVPERWQAAYEQVPVLADEYPSKEAFLAAEPDFAYASYRSAFTDDAVGDRAELAQEGISTYLSPFGCPEHRGEPATFERVFDEVRDVAGLFGQPDRGEAYVAEQEDLLAGLRDRAAGDGLDVFWFDSGDSAPLAGAGTGGPQLILDTVGATNVFADVEGGWAEVSWERVVEADPDVIVIADASWSPAQDKIDHLENDPVLRELRAVTGQRYVVVPFSATTPGARLVDGAQVVSDGLAALDR